VEPQLKLIARNFRTLESLEWSPRPGVNLLVGPNGSGKTTVLSALKFLSVLFRRDRAGALNAIRGVHLGRRGAPEAEPFHLELHHGEVHWTLDFPVNARGLTGTYGELLQHGDEVILRAKMFAEEWYLGTTRRKFPSDERCCARIFWDLTDPPAEWMRPLVDLLHNLRVYGVYNLEILRQPAQDDERAQTLHPTGRNLWQLLNLWKGSPRRHGDQFAWVLQAARDAFPDLIGDVEFEGSPPHGIIFPPGASDPESGLPAFLAADGLLTGLLHLTAVAGAPPGSIVAFDEMENQLHPFAIRSLLRSMRARAEERGLIILLTTHSPTVMDAFEGHEDRFYVMEPGRSPLPIALSELHDPVWLTSFSLGLRYDRGDVAAPSRPEE
jgi:energy-coupling factor transporter ATP-binding protein EcfA2